MIWAGFSYYGKTSLIFTSNRMDAKEYRDVLQRDLIPFGSNFMKENYIFQQDGAGAQTANANYEWFVQKGVLLIDWLAKSPDLDPIENLW